MNFWELLAKNMSNTVHLWLFTHIFHHGSALLAHLREVCVKLATVLLFILLLEISSEAPSSVWKILSINVIWFQWKQVVLYFPTLNKSLKDHGRSTLVLAAGYWLCLKSDVMFSLWHVTSLLHISNFEFHFRGLSAWSWHIFPCACVPSLWFHPTVQTLKW